MTWVDFYLTCFVVGFFLSILATLTGTMHLHVPHLHLPHLDFGDVHAHVDVGHGAGGHGAAPLNLGTLVAFLAWFGGSGYLLTRYSSYWFLVVFGLALMAGLIGAVMVFLFLAKILTREEAVLDPADSEMVGVLGKTVLPIRKGGTGEIVFTQGGTRHCAGARSEDGVAIPKGIEVVVTRYDKGIAYVKRWDELTNSEL